MLARTLFVCFCLPLLAVTASGQHPNSFSWQSVLPQHTPEPFFSWEHVRQPAFSVTDSARVVKAFDWAGPQYHGTNTETHHQSIFGRHQTVFIGKPSMTHKQQRSELSSKSEIPVEPETTNGPISATVTVSHATSLSASSVTPVAVSPLAFTTPAVSEPAIASQPEVSESGVPSFDEQPAIVKPSEPMGILPANVSQSEPARPFKEGFASEKYIGPLASSESLFKNLNIINPYQSIGGIRLEDVKLDEDSTAYTWASPAFAHRPLYFEQPNLERYGLGHCRLIQPWTSGIHFYGSVLLMPLKVCIQHPRESVCTLGHWRPGDHIDCQHSTFLGYRYLGKPGRFWDDQSSR